MTDLTKATEEFWLTQAQYDSRKAAGTLVVGAVYHVTDSQYLKTTTQSLSTAQQTAARNNISAITLEEYDSTATPEENILYYVIED